MFYNVVRRQPNTNNSSNPSTPSNSQRSGSVPPSTLMPRYHYSRLLPNSATNHSESTFSPRNQLETNMTATTNVTTNNHHHHQPNSIPSFKSTIIPVVANHRTTTPNKREFVQIPVTKEESTRSIPVSFINETNAISTPGNLSPKATFTNLLRPTTKYFQYLRDNSTEDPSGVPRLPTVSRRLSLTIPVTTNVNPNSDDEPIKASTPSSTVRQIPIRLPQATATVTSTPVYHSRISSAVLRSLPVSNNLQRQKTDIGESSSSTPVLSANHHMSSQTSDSHHSTPIRRAEVLAREAIQGLTRSSQQQQQQQRTNPVSSSESNVNRSPTLSRRIIINLKNNQSISLDSRLSSAMKPPPIPSSSRSFQRNNLYHIPILHEIQMPFHPATDLAENSSSTPTTSSNFKNEFHMEIPVSTDQENQVEVNQNFVHHERLPSSTNQTLKSILKRSSSRETVSRKNVSFMNA